MDLYNATWQHFFGFWTKTKLKQSIGAAIFALVKLLCNLFVQISFLFGYIHGDNDEGLDLPELGYGQTLMELRRE